MILKPYCHDETPFKYSGSLLKTHHRFSNLYNLNLSAKRTNVVNHLKKKNYISYVKTELLTHKEYIDHRLRDDPGLGGKGCRLALCGSDAVFPLGNYSTTIGESDGLLY
jgi:hypothetical protein